MAQIKIYSEKTLSDNKFPLKLYSFEKPGLEGKMHGQENEIYLRPDGATVLLVDEDEQKMLFTRQVRLATFLNGNDSGYLVETCAGTIDQGESPEQAMDREILEETGYRATSVKKICRAIPLRQATVRSFIFLSQVMIARDRRKKAGAQQAKVRISSW